MVWLQVVAVVGPIAGVVIGWWLSDRSDLGRLQREFTLQRVKTREDFLVEVLIEVEAQVVALLRLTESLRVEDRAQLDLQWRTLYATRHLRTGDAMRRALVEFNTARVEVAVTMKAGRPRHAFTEVKERINTARQTVFDAARVESEDLNMAIADAILPPRQAARIKRIRAKADAASRNYRAS